MPKETVLGWHTVDAASLIVTSKGKPIQVIRSLTIGWFNKEFLFEKKDRGPHEEVD